MTEKVNEVEQQTARKNHRGILIIRRRKILKRESFQAVLHQTTDVESSIILLRL